jgi:hypothetical protein
MLKRPSFRIVLRNLALRRVSLLAFCSLACFDRLDIDHVALLFAECLPTLLKLLPVCFWLDWEVQESLLSF